MRAYLLCFLSGCLCLAQAAASETCDARFEIIGWQGQGEGIGPLTLADFQDGPILLTEADVAEANVSRDYNDQVAVAFQLTRDGQDIFTDYTTAHVGKPFAIVYDGVLITAPRIMSPIYSGAGLITGQFTEREATEMAETLNTNETCAPVSGS